MLHPDDLRLSLADWIDVRTSLRRQEREQRDRLAAVQHEVHQWREHMELDAASGRPPLRELGALVEELETRERELAHSLLQLRQALLAAAAEIVRSLHAARRVG